MKTRQDIVLQELARAERNRLNALKSTGPRTAEGKARSSQNSLKHGLYAEHLLPAIEPELQADFDLFREQFYTEYAPAGATENALVEQIVQSQWRTLRFRRLEANYWNDPTYDHRDLNRYTPLQRLITSSERAFSKAVAELNKLQVERFKSEAIAAEKEKIRQAQQKLHGNHRPQPTESKQATAHSGFVPQNVTPTHRTPQSEAKPGPTSPEKDTQTASEKHSVASNLPNAA